MNTTVYGSASFSIDTTPNLDVFHYQITNVCRFQYVLSTASEATEQKSTQKVHQMHVMHHWRMYEGLHAHNGAVNRWVHFFNGALCTQQFLFSAVLGRL